MSRMFTMSILVLSGLCGLTSSVSAQSSGMLLGTNVFRESRGLRVSSTIPGYSAQGRIFRDDVLREVRFQDGNRVREFPTRTLPQIEYAKSTIGPNRQAALRLYRPGSGYQYLWVIFKPIGGSHPTGTYKAEMKTEAEQPGARAMFEKSLGSTSSSSSGSGSAASLFGR